MIHRFAATIPSTSRGRKPVVKTQGNCPMGVETVFVVASLDDVDRIAVTYDHQEWPSVYAKGQSEDSLAYLWHCMDNTIDWERAVERFEELSRNGEDGPWVFSVLEPLVACLASVLESTEDELFEKWKGFEGFEGCDEEDYGYIREELDGLLGLCRGRVSRDQPLLMWVSL